MEVIPQETGICLSLLRLLVSGVEILVENFGHGEHMYAVLLENRTHSIVTSNVTAITRILQVIGVDILPKTFDCLRTRELDCC